MSEAVVTSDTIEPPQKKVGFVKAAGVLGILGGIALIVVASSLYRGVQDRKAKGK